MRILVVDDDQVFREELESFLEGEGHEVATAPSARKALDYLETEERDLIFTDLKMPRQSGLDLLKEVRRRWPRTFVVLVTGFATVSTAVDAMKSGAFEYISKPFRAAQMLQVLKLVQEEQRFAGGSLRTEDPTALAASLAQSQGVPILLLLDRPGAPAPGVVTRPFDGHDSARMMDEVDVFFAENPRGGVVIGQAAPLLADHRLEDVLLVLRKIRDRCTGRGPFAIGIDPRQISRDQATALRSVLVASQVHGALEAIASPIRRRVLMRLAEGPATFSEVMRAIELDDSPKLSFHLHRLMEEGLIAHGAERYKLASLGEGTVELLREMEQLAVGSTVTSLLFASSARTGVPASPRRAHL